MTVLESVSLENWKTKEMAVVIKKVSELFPVKHGSLLLIIPGKLTDTIERSAKNIPKVDVMEAKNLNALDVMARKNLIILKDSVEVIEKNFHA
jgi:ribosomal protein L4